VAEDLMVGRPTCHPNNSVKAPKEQDKPINRQNGGKT